MYRAEKHGLARDAELKVKSKWEPEAASIAMNWVANSTGIPLPGDFEPTMEHTQAYLKDGYVLAHLANFAKNGSIEAKLLSKRQTMVFKQMEMISIFLSTMTKHGMIKETELFQTVDLFESVNLPAVITTLEALGRRLQAEGRGFGKAESVGEKKQWTDEQLKAGQNIIGLQMGTNKGANQSGINMGKSRAIMD